MSDHEKLLGSFGRVGNKTKPLTPEELRKRDHCNANVYLRGEDAALIVEAAEASNLNRTEFIRGAALMWAKVVLGQADIHELLNGRTG